MRRLVRWRGAVVAALLCTVLGVGLGAEAFFLLGVVALGVVAIGYLSTSPGGEVRVERELTPDAPDPGVPVTVSLTLYNESDRIQPDVRLVDDPPAEVAVIGGVPAVTTSIQPGESVTHEYEIAPPRGTHEFGTPLLRRRNLAGTLTDTEEVDVDGLRTFTCETLLDAFPLREQTIQYVGRSPTDDGGSGIEFYATRQYRPGDPINRIDWHRLARTGELATVEYREERAVTVVFVVDDRPGIHYEQRGGGPDSFDLTLYAASKGIVASMNDGNRTGVATYDHGGWIEPGADEGTKQRTESLFEHISDGAVPTMTDGGVPGDARSTEIDTVALSRLSERLPRNAQIVFCTPLTDNEVVETLRQLAGRGHDVTVLSPDITTSIGGDNEQTLGVEVERAWRTIRVSRLRSMDIAVIDWSLEEPIPVELKRLLRRWRRDA